jgi:hypothetical protein
MRARSRAGRSSQNEAGMTLILVAGAMVVLLGISALAIDLVALYVARNEAQRAADAAALAGATIFVAQGCTTGVGGCVPNGPQEAPATTQAINVAAQNLVFGQAPSSSTVATSFSYPNSEEPQITVTVYRDSAHSNAMPTFFAKIFGIKTANVSASATAEAYNPSGGGVSVGVSCLKPFLVPNCDPDHPVPSTSPAASKNCGGTGNNDGATIACPPGVSGTCYPSYFFDPNRKATIVNPGTYNPGPPPSGGVIGEPWQLHSNAAPSQWYLIGYTGNSGAQLRAYIQTCAPAVIACHSSLNTANGRKVGPTDQGIDALIHASADGLGNGQDSICSPTTTPACATPPFPITGGANNPNPALVGKTFFPPGSDSVASVAVYDGSALSPGGSTVTVVGFMELFIRDVTHQGTEDLIDTVILNLGGCGTTGSSVPPVVTAGGSTIPIRLIHQ